jgi:hypothetical protein
MLIGTARTLPEHHRIHTERSNMHCLEIACTRSFGRSLTSAEGQNLEYFKLNSKFKTMKSYLTHFVVKSSQSHSLSVHNNLYDGGGVYDENDHG